MKNRTIAKLLVCSTILANLPVAAMANEVQQLAEDSNKWSNEGNNWTYTLNSDTTLWGKEAKTYKLDSDSTYKILFDTAVNVGLDSNVETDDTTSKLTIEGKSATASNFNLNGYTITGDVTFKNVNVVGTVDRANAYVDETVTINQKAVVTVTGAENVTIVNGNGDFANGAGLALVGDVLTVTPAEGYTVAVTGATDNGDGTYTVTGAVTVTATPAENPEGTANLTIELVEDQYTINEGEAFDASSVKYNVYAVNKDTGAKTLADSTEYTATLDREVTGTGTYTLTVTDVDGVVGEETLVNKVAAAEIYVTVNEIANPEGTANLTVELVEDQYTIEKGEAFDVSSVKYSVYAVNKDTGAKTLAAPTEYTATLDREVTETGTYTLTVTDTDGMVGEETLVNTTATARIQVTVNEEQPSISYQITFHTGEGAFADGSKQLVMNTDENGKLAELPAAPVREGYEFTNWTFTNGDVVTADTVFVGPTDVYAKWTEVAETSVWEKQEDGSYVLNPDKLTGAELVVPASTTATTYTIPAGTVLDVTNATVGKGSILRVEQGATFTQTVDFVLGGRLIAQTTNFKGQVWFSAPKVREASATTDGTVELTGVTTVNNGMIVAPGVALTVSGTVEGQGSITSQGDLTVSGTVSTPVVVAAGTANITGTASTIDVTGPASVVVADTAKVEEIVIAENAGASASVKVKPGASAKVEDNRPDSIVYMVSVTGKGTLYYGADTLVNGEDTTVTQYVYKTADDTAVQLIMEAAQGYKFDSLKVNGAAVETTKNTQGLDTYSVKQDTNLKSIAASFVDSFIGGGGGGSTGGGSTGGGSSTSGTTSTVTVSASTSVSGKIMTATVSASNMEKAIKEVLALAEKNDTTPVVKVSLSLGTSIEGISVTLPTEALKALAAVSNAKLTIESSVASVTFDANALSDVLSQAGETFTLNAGKADMSNFTAAQLLGAGDGSVFDINITSDESFITNFSKGTATVTLPYALKVNENASDIVVYYMADNGILDSQSTQYDAANRKATFTTNHFSIYVVDAAWANPFNDVAEGDWFYNAVRYANENSLMAGVSDTTFAPNMNLTRAMVVQMLYSLEGKPAVVSGSNFSDVKAGDWYADAVNWAASKGIVSGYSETTYAPNDSVTREQLSLILYKYAQSKNVTVNDYSSLSGFVDGAKTSDWAEDAVEWAVGAGLISSTSTSTKTLDPTGTATRAQVAQIVANFVEQVM